MNNIGNTDVNFWQTCVNNGLHTQLTRDEIAALGLTGDTIGQYWYAMDMLDNAKAAYLLANPPTLMPYLRTNEQLLGIGVSSTERHCGWGKHSLKGEICRKPVMQIQWRWVPEYGKRMNATGTHTTWRHVDGTPIHRNNDEQNRPEFMWEHYDSCTPLGYCEDCGKEWVKDHCSSCHNNDVLKLDQQAYQDVITCTTPGCAYEHRYSIGD